MTTITLGEHMQRRLANRGKGCGRSPAEEALHILRETVGDGPEPTGNIADALRAALAPTDGFELQIPPRGIGGMVDVELQRRLEYRAKVNERSLDDEARAILREAVEEAPEMPEDIVALFDAHFAPIGGWDEFEPPPRDPIGDPPSFD